MSITLCPQAKEATQGRMKAVGQKGNNQNNHSPWSCPLSVHAAEFHKWVLNEPGSQTLITLVRLENPVWA